MDWCNEFPVALAEPPWSEPAPFEKTWDGDGQLPGITVPVHCEDWQNKNLHVVVYKKKSGHVIALMICSLDGTTVRDWRTYQWIKNRFMGEEAEAVELFPRESDLVDPSNAYYLWRITGRDWGGRGIRRVLNPWQAKAPQRGIASNGAKG